MRDMNKLKKALPEARIYNDLKDQVQKNFILTKDLNNKLSALKGSFKTKYDEINELKSIMSDNNKDHEEFKSKMNEVE